jgi:hypothetical protein
MAKILSYPFRLQPNGDVAVVEQTSDAGVAEQIAVLILTRAGERPLQPAFGIPDPVFEGLDALDVAAGLALFGPPAEVTGLEVGFADALTQEIDVSFA